MKKIIVSILFLLLMQSLHAAYILIPMDDSQKNHLKAYGISYWVLQQENEVSWLLNYRGGSFMCLHHQLIENECECEKYVLLN